MAPVLDCSGRYIFARYRGRDDYDVKINNDQKQKSRKAVTNKQDGQ